MSTPVEDACPECGRETADNFEHCPHCYEPLPPVNVRRASRAAERAALQARYDAAVKATTDRAGVVQAFEAAVAQSKAVMVLSLTKLAPLIGSKLTIYPAYRDLADLRFIRDPGENDANWDVRRVQAEAELLGSDRFIGKVHYAALSTDGSGLTSYSEGDTPVTVTLKEKMIASRASVFETNSGRHMERGHSKFPAGWRATWDERGKLGVAKLAEWLSKGSQSADFSKILLTRGLTSLDDEFIEVQVFGTMTVETFDRVVVTVTHSAPQAGLRSRPHRGKTVPKVLRDECDKAAIFFFDHNIPFETQ